MSETVLGLTMIVKDEEESIGAMLDSILPHVDRAVIVDTGSTDRTRKIILEKMKGRGPGFNLIRRPWPGSFGVARQEALDALLEQYPETTHVCWFDADDIIIGGEYLRAVAEQVHPGLAAGMMHYAYAHDPWGNLSCSHFRERVIRVEWIRGWVNDVHEVLLTAPGVPNIRVAAPAQSGLALIPNNSWPVAQGGVEVVHVRPPGKDTTGRNRAILEDEVHRLGDNTPARTLFYLAQEHAIAAAHALEDEKLNDVQRKLQHDASLREAIATLDRHERVADWDEERYQARHRKADMLRALGEHERAVAVEAAGIADLPQWPDAWLGTGESYLHLGRFEAAIAYTDAGLTKPYPDTPLILNPLDYTFTPLVVKGEALLRLGRVDEARAVLVRAVEMQPGNLGVIQIAQEAEEAANRSQIRLAVLGLDEALARHDENLKAARLLEECVPYFLQGDAEIAERRRRRRLGVRHVRPTEFDSYETYYGDDNPVYPITMQFNGLYGYGEKDGPTFRECIKRFCESIPRALHLTRGLYEQVSGDSIAGLKVLDLGCNDGWLGWYLAVEHGVEYVGYDLSVKAIEQAKAWGEHYRDILAEETPSFHVGLHPEMPEGWREFDAAVCFEVIEHVPDVADQLALLSEFVTPKGRVYVSTPNGAYERGRVEDWNSPEARGHVRAITARDLAGYVLDAGATIESFEETVDRLSVCSFTPGSPPLGRVHLYLGAAGAETWHATDTLSKGLGGSETMAVRVGSELVKRGWRVTIYANVEQGAVQGVEYLPWYLFDPMDPCDVLISSRDPALAKDSPNAKTKVLWLHDADYPNLHDHVGDWDHIVHVGEWQVEKLWAGWAFPARSKLKVIPNGLPVRNRYPNGDRPFDSRSPWVVYSSSPDRGLMNLLEVWPRIVKAVPNAQLHITYGFTATWKAMEQAGATHLTELRQRIEECFSMPGVIWHGSVGQLELAKIQQQARVWAYPTDFPEVSCITAMEAQAAGLAIVATDVAELPTTLTGSGALILPPHAEWEKRDRDKFVRAVTTRLKNPKVWGKAHTMAYYQAWRFDMDVIGQAWHDLLVREDHHEDTSVAWPVIADTDGVVATEAK